MAGVRTSVGQNAQDGEVVDPDERAVWWGRVSRRPLGRGVWLLGRVVSGGSRPGWTGQVRTKDQSPDLCSEGRDSDRSDGGSRYGSDRVWPHR